MNQQLQFQSRPGLTINAMPAHCNPYLNLFSRPPIFGGWSLQNLISGCSNTVHDVRRNLPDQQSLIVTGISYASFLKPVLCGDNVHVYGAVHPENGTKIAVDGRMIVNRQALGLHIPKTPIEARFADTEVAMDGRVMFKLVTPQEMAGFKNAGTDIPEHILALRKQSDPIQRLAANDGSARTDAGFMRAGWTLAQMDLSAAVAANVLSVPSRQIFVTGSVKDIVIKGTPCYGDAVEIYTELRGIGAEKPWTVTVDVHALAHRSHRNVAQGDNPDRRVISGQFNMICVDRETMRPACPEIAAERNLTGTSDENLPDDVRFWHNDHEALLMPLART